MTQPQEDLGGPVLHTERLRLRPWQPDDAERALGIYGDPEVIRWLNPAMSIVPDQRTMRAVLEQWAAEHQRLPPPAGRWSVESRADGRLIGGIALVPLPPGGEDAEVSYQVLNQERGQGFASEAVDRVVTWAFHQGMPEVFVVARPANSAGVAVARKLGFQWVGETTKYYGLRLQVFRLRPADLEADAPG